MFHNIFFLTILFYLAISLSTSTPARFPPNGDGFTAPLIPPLSPRSPFYSRVLAANNLTTPLTNITLNRTHYNKWIQTKKHASLNEYSPVNYMQDINTLVMTLDIGYPPQTMYGTFDTGSNLVWIKCDGNQDGLPVFNTSWSGHYNGIDCKDTARCNRTSGEMECRVGTKDGPCVYNIDYYDTHNVSAGVVASDDIKFGNGRIFQDFKFGCSDNNSSFPVGVIGASQSAYSLPMQLYPNNPRFSYCISPAMSRTSLVKFGSDATLVGQTVKTFKHSIQNYYYLDVIGLQVNKEAINVAPSMFNMSTDGFTGFVIASGHLRTSLAPQVFAALKDKIVKILGDPTPYNDLEICYPISKFGSFQDPRPTIGIQFRDSVFELKTSEVWHQLAAQNLECLQVQKTAVGNLSILGAEQLVNVNVGHDLKNKVMYLAHMECLFS